MRKSDNLPVTFTKSDVEIIARERAIAVFFHWMCIDSAIVYSTEK